MTQLRLQRRIKHHILLAIISTILLITFYIVTDSDYEMFRLSMATAYTGLILVGVTLFLGPMNVILKKRNPVSTDIRRDAGIWGGVISLVHVIFGIQVHMSSIWLYFFREAGEAKEWALRSDLFGFANYTGLLAALIVLMLLALSNDRSLRRLKKPRWKSLQRFNYGLLALILVHGILYQIAESRNTSYVVAFGGIILLISIPQIYGLWKHKSATPISGPAENEV